MRITTDCCLLRNLHTASWRKNIHISNCWDGKQSTNYKAKRISFCSKSTGFGYYSSSSSCSHESTLFLAHDRRARHEEERGWEQAMTCLAPQTVTHKSKLRLGSGMKCTCVLTQLTSLLQISSLSEALFWNLQSVHEDDWYNLLGDRKCFPLPVLQSLFQIKAITRLRKEPLVFCLSVSHADTQSVRQAKRNCTLIRLINVPHHLTPNYELLCFNLVEPPQSYSGL